MNQAAQPLHTERADRLQAKPERRPASQFAKRTFDILFAAAALAALSPLFALGAALAKLQSPGSVFFLGERIGRGGKRFRLVKFRTMVSGSENGAAITAAGDRRVTRIGSFLRRAKIDELPNLLNVLTGSMSLVGPRPETPNYVALYSEQDRRALAARPGITGPAQLLLRDEEELLARQPDPETYYIERLIPLKLRMDIAYLETRTLRKDIVYIARTFGVLLSRIVPKRRPKRQTPMTEESQQ